MVREENVKLMSKIAIYEKRSGRTEIPMSGYYKSDYVRLNVLKTVVSATVSFFVVVAVLVFYKLDYLLANIFKIEYKSFGIGLLLIYVVWIFLNWLVARILYAFRYEKARPHIIEYNHNLKKLEEESYREIMRAKGGVVINDDFIDF